MSPKNGSLPLVLPYWTVLKLTAILMFNKMSAQNLLSIKKSSLSKVVTPLPPKQNEQLLLLFAYSKRVYLDSPLT